MGGQTEIVSDVTPIMMRLNLDTRLHVRDIRVPVHGVEENDPQ